MPAELVPEGGDQRAEGQRELQGRQSLAKSKLRLRTCSKARNVTVVSTFLISPCSINMSLYLRTKCRIRHSAERGVDFIFPMKMKGPEEYRLYFLSL